MTPDGTAVYLYGVVPSAADGVPVPPGVAGRPVAPITRGGLAALASEVPLSDFDAEPLKCHLEDLTWLEATARAHHEVVATAAAHGEIVPFRLCTLFADEERVGEMLEAERDRLTTSLDRLRGRAEWAVKVLAQPAATPTAAAATPAATPASAGDTPAEGRPGHAFFARKRAQAAARRSAAVTLDQAVTEIEQRLLAEASAVVRLPPQPRDLSGHRGEMILNAACLVESDRADAFAHAARASARRFAEQGVRLELTGPFAPYNFASTAAERG